MQTTEKLDIPFEIEINQLARIQVQQSEIFNLSISEQFGFFLTEYSTVTDQYLINKQTELTKKIELVDFMFELHMESFGLPKQFVQTFNLLKVITTKSALYHSAFFTHSHNPVAHYLRTASDHIKQKLTPKNSDECLELLHSNIQLLIIKYQSDPGFFDIQSKAIINIFKVNKALKKASKSNIPTLKTSALNDRFTSDVSHANDDTVKNQNNAHLFAARNLQTGEWLNLKQGSKITLIKLIWKADDNSEFIFVDKNGEKVKQCNLLELAADLENSIISTVSNTLSSKQRNSSFLKTIG